MLSDNEKKILASHRIPEEDVERVTSDLVVTFKDGSQRQICEVWSRVMGYHRPTTEYNKGKYAEFADRKPFIEPDLPDDAA